MNVTRRSTDPFGWGALPDETVLRFSQRERQTLRRAMEILAEARTRGETAAGEEWTDSDPDYLLAYAEYGVKDVLDLDVIVLEVHHGDGNPRDPGDGERVRET